MTGSISSMVLPDFIMIIPRASCISSGRTSVHTKPLKSCFLSNANTWANSVTHRDHMASPTAKFGWNMLRIMLGKNTL
eukprot:CAMPEP_0118719372 /NCGR_PEP_ID=MMETSP0800-20121206/29434_1 /TAXON_ID=210618 ORGANISM="Striatella unipunctata, Strain CCMP2910" /NCGR_SAMPLE_ID=MMETSP0800 /ASSEMBLY_ACC=CAM_ASM_000638 /LENGTH=77 /DNA_ID=CAMNT_0006626725 /DNA_START=90 /DNA_END=323 /DNA_ORIENTATION=+